VETTGPEGQGGRDRGGEKAFPARTVFSALAGFLLALVFLNLLLPDPSAEMPAIAAPGPSMPAFRGLEARRGPGEIRIFVVGASLTSGYPYQPQGAASYAALLEQGLSALFPGRKILCRPAAVPALDSPRLAELVRRALRFDPSLICVALGSNEYANRIFFGRSLVPADPRGKAEDRISRARLLFKALRRLLPGGKVKASRAVQEKIAGRIFRSRPGKPGLSGLPVERPDRMLLLDRMARSMREMSAACAARGVPLVFLAAAHDLAGSWPWSDLGKGGKAEADRLISLYRKGRRKGLLGAVLRARRDHPGRADLAFLEGLLLEEEGRALRARKAFLEARDADGVPMHLTGPVLERIASTAAALGRPFLDLNAPLGEGRPGNLPDPALFLDYGHLDLEGHLRLALFLARRLSPLGLLPPLPPGWEGIFRSAVDSHISRTIGKESLRKAKANLCWADGNFFMLFGNFRDALPLLEEAFRRGAEGRPGADLPYAWNLLFCAYTLAGKEQEVTGLSEKERAALFRKIYGRLLAAARKGRLHRVLEEIMGEKKN